ncbi:HAMP domain-containing sensor histidine kinase [Streptomyces sp. MNP-20]|uniref:sensor histidine kinase n=1 Tax=Streptomyces sp. MNP-20 TaxID=2721165 RepID=UPI001552A56B|nr:HAMP domain-containing sensor histidine kinase [Streptomyces sp. MNP-20]
MNALTARPAPRTLRGHLSLLALATAALLMIVLTLAFNAIARQHLRHQADGELRSRAAAVAATVDATGPTVHVLETPHDEALDANVWIYAGDRLLERPSSAAASGPLTTTAAHLVQRGDHGCVTARARGPVRLCALAVRPARSAATIVTALDLTPYRSSADALLLGSLVLDAVMLTVTYALTRLSVGRALRPVRTMTEQAAKWSAVASEERFGAARRPAELARLGVSLDALLDRIRTLLRHERRLTGELSHELRTPLSRIVAELDWWRARPRTAAQTRATHEVIAEAARSMTAICDTLLGDARADASTAPGTADTLTTLHRLTQQLTIPRHLTVTATGDTACPVPRAGVPDALLERIVSPLLANALRYAATAVTLHAARDGATVRIEVTDDGPGVPPEFLGHLFAPGRRAAPDDGHDGAGLGLPLARRLARSAGGEVRHDRPHHPGARFVISLPAA